MVELVAVPCYRVVVELLHKVIAIAAEAELADTLIVYLHSPKVEHGFLERQVALQE